TAMGAAFQSSGLRANSESIGRWQSIRRKEDGGKSTHVDNDLMPVEIDVGHGQCGVTAPDQNIQPT
nr:hypothetical protein [Tanacetum cinerariifolium]